MSVQNFTAALDFVLRWEGEYSDHPDDPGGATKFGISLSFLRAAGLDLNRDGHFTAADVKGLTKTAAGRIYRERFWVKLRLDEFPGGLDFAVFDAAVNQGPSAAAKMLQRAVGAKPDGIIGSRTVKAARARPGALLDFSARRAVRYARTPKVLIFGRGWFRRLLECYRQAAARAIPPM